MDYVALLEGLRLGYGSGVPPESLIEANAFLLGLGDLHIVIDGVLLGVLLLFVGLELFLASLLPLRFSLAEQIVDIGGSRAESRSLDDAA